MQAFNHLPNRLNARSPAPSLALQAAAARSSGFTWALLRAAKAPTIRATLLVRAPLMGAPTGGLTRGGRVQVTAGLSGDVDIAVGMVARQLRAYGASAFGLDELDLVAFSPSDGSPGGLV